MICHASRSDLEIQLSIGYGPSPEEETVLKLAMSLKRHAYEHIAESDSKDQNSVCYRSVDVPALIRDAVDVGLQFQERLAIEPAILENNPEGFLDYTAASRRVYRFDEYHGRPGFNHFYPLRGPGVWNCDMREFEWLQTLARIEIDWSNHSEKSKFLGWSAFLQDRQEWRDLRVLLAAVSDAGDTLTRLEALRVTPKQLRQPVAALGNLVFNRVPGFSDDESDGSPSRSRSGSFSDSSSVTSSDSGSDGGRFW